MGQRLAAIGASLLAFVLVISLGTDTIVRAVTEDTVEIQDGAGNVVDSVLLGDAVTFFVQDSDLATTGTGVGTWTAIETAVPAGTWWSFATGAADPAARLVHRYEAVSLEDGEVLTDTGRGQIEESAELADRCFALPA